MAAGFATLTELKEHPEIYGRIEALSQHLAAGIRENSDCTVNQIGSLLCAFFSQAPVTSYQSAKASDTKTYGKYFHHMLERGIYLAPAQFEAMFVSGAHTQEEIERTIQAVTEFSAG